MNIIKLFNKYSIYLKILIFLKLLLIILIIINYKKLKKESFDNLNNKIFTNYDNKNLYDNFYVTIYDKLHNDNNKNDIISNIIKNKLCKTSVILDVGCGTGEIVSKLSDYNILGLDKSNSMIALCKNKFPNNNFIEGDILNNNNFNYNYNYSHILCLNLTIYYIKNKKLLLKNCYNMLNLNGELILHLVDKNLYNRSINMGKINNFNPCKNSNNKIIKNNINFNDFNYTCINTLHNKDIITIDETIKFNNNSVRNNTHTLYFDSNKNILLDATTIGFIINEKIKINNTDGEYIYVLKKNII